MFLAVNIGNSKVNMAVFSGNEIVKTFSIDSLKDKDSDFYKNEFERIFFGTEITECAIISVVNELDNVIKMACDKAFEIDSVILKHNSAKNIEIKSGHPESAGMDRVANVAAVSDYPLPAIVVDVGTAVTFDVLSEKKEFLGGIIMPGVNMQLKSLAVGTSKLPEIEPKESPYAIGNDTETCILAGVVRGTAAAIDGLLKQCIDELGDCKTIVLTGGQAELISQYMKHSVSIKDKNWTMLGIKKMYDEQS